MGFLVGPGALSSVIIRERGIFLDPLNHLLQGQVRHRQLSVWDDLYFARNLGGDSIQ